MVQDLIKVNNRNEKELILDSLAKRHFRWASGEEANCERMRKVMPNESYLVIVDNELYWDTVDDAQEFEDEVLDKTKTVDEFIKGFGKLPDVDLALIKVKYGEEDDILDYLASLNVRWLRKQLANEWRVTREETDDDEYYLVILNRRELTWAEIGEIGNEDWELFTDIKNVRSEQHLEAEEFIERFVK